MKIRTSSPIRSAVWGEQPVTHSLNHARLILTIMSKRKGDYGDALNYTLSPPMYASAAIQSICDQALVHHQKEGDRITEQGDIRNAAYNIQCT